jgi:hypothetical protein
VRAGALTKTVFVFPPAATLDERWQFTVAVLSGSGVLVASLPVVTRPGAGGDAQRWRPVARGSADRRDEAAYRVAVDQALAGPARERGGVSAANGAGAT